MLFLREYGVQINFDFAKYARKALTKSIIEGIKMTPGTPNTCIQHLFVAPLANAMWAMRNGRSQ